MRKNSLTTVAALTSFVSGLKKNQPKELFLIDGGAYTAQELVTVFESVLTARQAVPVAKGAYQKAIRSADALTRQYRAVAVQLKQSLQNQAGNDAALLADYGLTPRKSQGARTPQVNVAAADKARATRAARHTMGSRQKRQINGATVAAAAAALGVPSVATPTATTSPAAPAFLPAETSTPSGQ